MDYVYQNKSNNRGDFISEREARQYKDRIVARAPDMRVDNSGNFQQDKGVLNLVKRRNSIVVHPRECTENRKNISQENCLPSGGE